MHQLPLILGSMLVALWAVILFRAVQANRKKDGR